MEKLPHLVDAMLRGCPDAAAVVDSSGIVLEHNAQFAVMTGLGRRALKTNLRARKPIYQLLGSPNGADRDAVQGSFQHNRVHRLAEITVRNCEDLEFVVWFSSSPLVDGEGRVFAVMLQYRDVSAEARMQQRFKELLELSRAHAADLERVVEARTRELSAAFEEVRRLSRTDPLTGLLNRRAFAELAQSGIGAAQRHERAAALVMTDIDHFKRVNDQHGHAVGDAVLLKCAKVLKRAFRNTDAVARFGGEEFVVFLSETTREGAMQAAERCRQALERARVEHPSLSGPISKTASFGVSVYPDHGTTLDQLVAAADEALYAAKRGGRNRVVLWESEARGTGLYAMTPPSESAVRPRGEDTGKVAPLERERALIIDPIMDRRSEYQRVLERTLDVAWASTPSEALALCRTEEFTVFVADMVQLEGNGPALLGQMLQRQPGSVRILMVEDVGPFQQLLGSNLASADQVLLRRDYRHLSAAIDACRARRDSYRSHPLAKSPQPSRWALQDEEMARVLREKRVTVALQPIVTCAGRKVVAHEALCRVHSNDAIEPVDLFYWALREAEIWNLGREVRGLGLRYLRQHSELPLFLNLHPAELLDPELSLLETELDNFANKVVFEITERVTIGDFDRVARAMNHLRARGYRFAVDDLGAGYAGLNSVAMLKPDFVKVDMKIVRDIGKWPVKARLLESVILFAREADVQVVAEGVESEDEAEVICGLGCDLCQGFLYGAPRPLDELDDGGDPT